MPPSLCQKDTIVTRKKSSTPCLSNAEALSAYAIQDTFLFLRLQSSTEQCICHALWVASIAARTSAALGMDFPAP